MASMQKLAGLMRRAIEKYDMIQPGDRTVSYTHLTLPTTRLV